MSPERALRFGVHRRQAREAIPAHVKNWGVPVTEPGPKQWVVVSSVAAAVVAVAYGWTRTVQGDGWEALYEPWTHPVSAAMMLALLTGYATAAVKTREWLGTLLPGLIISWIAGAILVEYLL